MKTTDTQDNNQSIDLFILKKEVDGLQIAMHEQRQPWYKNISLVISIAAFIFSLATTYYSNLRVEKQDILNSRIQLNGLVEKLSSMPKDLEFNMKYEFGDDGAKELYTNLTNQDAKYLAKQAAEIVKELPLGYVTSTEYTIISTALFNNYEIESGIDLLTKAIKITTNPFDLMNVLVTRADIYFLIDDVDAGRNDYKEALNVFSHFKNKKYSEITKKQNFIWVELRWADAESLSIKTALYHVSEAENHLSGMKDSNLKRNLEKQINRSKNWYQSFTLNEDGSVLTAPSTLK